MCAIFVLLTADIQRNNAGSFSKSVLYLLYTKHYKNSTNRNKEQKLEYDNLSRNSREHVYKDLSRDGGRLVSERKKDGLEGTSKEQIFPHNPPANPP